MLKKLQTKSLVFSAALMSGMMLNGHAAFAGNTFSNIAKNVTTSVQDVPGMLTGMSYLFGILIGVLGILKIKDHVENPQQTPLKDGAIRLAAGGGLFALPIVYEAMFNTVGTGAGVKAALLNQVQFAVG